MTAFESVDWVALSFVVEEPFAPNPSYVYSEKKKDSYFAHLRIPVTFQLHSLSE